MDNNSKNLNNSVKRIYTPLSEALVLLKERFYDKDLREKVLAYYKSIMPPDILINSPKAVFSRPIATPNFEFTYFMDLINKTGLEPLVLEYPDKFVANNNSKYHLCKLCVLDKSKIKHRHIDTHSIVDFNNWEGEQLSSINTKKNNSLIKQHHDFLYKIYPEMKGKVYDFSDWFQQTRGEDDSYYVSFLSLFVCFGILFDNYLINDPSEKDFVLNKVIPSYDKVVELFGVKPIICPLLPISNEFNEKWYWYNNIHNSIIKNTFI